ncbi:MAG: ParB/RepB/Spo0J family partition protein [Atribacterota bacterium]|jgi:ParB family chromosome partitioning protein|nr:ParB/RepB/Spo0J family partition protein [Atribacterota bacterium]MDD3641572.1 ParB/RepB/Spo0J family partition protein [Atribacterota bacterium]MDD4288117.1 ParB/RepB/Spo0J family partition protein [Atribacterota bacterium]MDD4764970.1 ParB/RepB/Spo0J family partition protein [Atribacterota bacterium]MDI9597579.1 ParB/RepB/Spo0J family partition protein [Atribacterota bacterium]
MAKKGLGRGLESLIPISNIKDRSYVTEVDVNQLWPNLYQPRQEFDQEKMDELKESIKAHGIIQPIIVRESADGYEIVAGERRLKAAKELGMKKVPVIIRQFNNLKSFEIALVENIQREDLNPIDQAFAFKRLSEEFNLTHQELAEMTGKSRTFISNIIRLLNLDDWIKERVAAGKITLGHAKVLLGLENKQIQQEFGQKIIEQELSVRDLERIISIWMKKSRKNFQQKRTIQTFPELEKQLIERFGTKVKIKFNGKRGNLSIEFYSNEDLDRIYSLLLK